MTIKLTTTPTTPLNGAYTSNIDNAQDGEPNHVANYVAKHATEQQSFTGLLAFYDSVCGTTHPNNEDSVKIAPPFYGLADGVGGGAAGDVASATLLNTCATAQASSLDDESICELLYQADSDIKQAINAVTASKQQRGASTLVATWLDTDGQGVFTWVGDARIYRIDILAGTATVGHEDTATTAVIDSSVHLTQLTTDHTYANVKDHVPEGWQADDPAYMVGVGRRVIGAPQVIPVQINRHQGLLLCSDGVHKFVSPAKMSQALEELIALHGLQAAINTYAQRLVALAVELGSYDDCSALVVYNAGTPAEIIPAQKTELDIATPTNIATD